MKELSTHILNCIS